jgi:EAL domain-containing protein (putative c-di-GMP-specific phosphodiesterase class I)
MAHIVGLKVIAEGIETKEELRILKQLKCDLGQGFIFDKPLSIKAFQQKYLNQNCAKIKQK